MKTPDARDLLEVLACDIEARPKGAPSIVTFAAHITSVQRDEKAVRVAFQLAVAGEVAAFVEAERLCCSSIDWQLQHDPELLLTIGASPSQLDALAEMLERE